MPLRIYILLLFIFLTVKFSLAQEAGDNQPVSALDNEPSVTQTSLPVSGEVLEAPSRARADNDGYTYDLKQLIDKSRKNIKKVNEKIKEQAVLKRNQMREQKAREYFDMGKQLTQEGKFDEARHYYEKAINITEHPEMQGYIKESERKLRAQEVALRRLDQERLRQLTQDEKSREIQASEAYQEGVVHFRQKNFQESRDAFERVRDLIPDYKATESYLQIIDQEIAAEDKRLAVNQRKELERQQEEAEKARMREKEVWRKEIERKENSRKQELKQQADIVYNQAVDLYKEKKFKEAKEKFQEVAWVFPDYKATNKYLKTIDNDAKVYEEQQQELKRKLLDKQKWEEEIARRKQEEQDKKLQEEKDRLTRQRLEEEAKFIYDSAVSLFDKKDYEGALAKFQDIEKTVPGYKGTRIFIAKIEQIKLKLEQEAKLEQQRQERLKKQQEAKQAVKDGVKDISKTKQKSSSLASEVKDKTGEASKEQVVENKEKPSSGSIKVTVINAHHEETTENIEQKKAQVERLAQLTARSKALLTELEGIADDRQTKRAFNKISQLTDRMAAIKEDNDKELRKMRELVLKAEQEKLMQEKKLRQEKARELYKEAQQFYQEKDLETAKMRLIESRELDAEYRPAAELLSKITGQEVPIKLADKSEKVIKKQLPSAQVEQKEQAQEKIKESKEQLVELSSKVAQLQQDIVSATSNEDFDLAQEKLTELENVVAAIKSIKTVQVQEKLKTMTAGKQRSEEKRIAKEAAKAKQEDKKQIMDFSLSKTEKKSMAGKYDDETPAKYRQRQDIKQRDNLYNQGVDLFKRKKYAEARLVFTSLQQRDDPRALGWIQKIDRALNKEYIRVSKGKMTDDTFMSHQKQLESQSLAVEKKQIEKREKYLKQIQENQKARELEQQRQQQYLETLKMRNMQKETQANIDRYQQPEDNVVPPTMTKEVEPINDVREDNENRRQQRELSRQRKEFFERKYLQDQPPASADHQTGEVNHVKSAPVKLTKKERQEKDLLQKQLARQRLQVENQRKQLQQHMRQQAEVMYQQGMRYYRNGDYQRALTSFKATEELVPGYKDTSRLMTKLNQSGKSQAQQPAMNQATVNTTTKAEVRNRMDSIEASLDQFDPDVK